MSTQSLLTSLFQYKAWADRVLWEAVSAHNHRASDEIGAAARILNHAHIVDRIFAAHLQGKPHAYATNEPAEAPKPADLLESVCDTDQWYIDYVTALSPERFAEEIAFRFTDGKSGRMSREEILAHVITHGGYHRGEVGRLLPQISYVTSGDVFAGYLHRFEPHRKERRPTRDSVESGPRSGKLELIA